MELSDSIEVLAGTMWGEARGHGIGGMRDVGSVVMNRVNHPRWWGSSIISVCLDPWQFSCWNEGDPNRRKILTVTTQDPQFAQAMEIARDIVANMNPDQTGGADSYFAIGMESPSWAARARHTVDRYGHSFWRVELPAPKTVTPTALDGDPDAPTHSAQPPDGDIPPTADELMAEEQKALNAGQPVKLGPTT
jgi:hypothetical protein